MKRVAPWLLALAALAAVPGSAGAKTPATEADGGAAPSWVLQAALLPEAPVIDGRMDEAAWDHATLLDRFTQLETQEGEPVTERTEIRIGYDHEKLYLGARCFDSEPEKVVATVLDRDGSLSYEDAVLLVLDTFQDHRGGFLFMVNPLGSTYDALVRQEGEELVTEWDGIWWAEASRDAEGWTAEVAIPFRTLRFPNRPVQTWGMNVGRFIARKREEAYWKPMARSYGFWARYKVSKYGQLTGLENLERGGRFQVEPYLTTGHRKRRGGDSEWILEPGLDGKAHLTSDLVADLTLNTDFAETEADQQEINLTRFKLYFPEKREFFLEGADLFYFGERPEPYKEPEDVFFFSRRIGLSEGGEAEIPVLGGAKIAGRAGRTGVGLLAVSTDEEDYLNAEGDTVHEPRTNYGVLRLKREIGDRAWIGFMGLDKSPSGDDDFRGYGLDWDFAARDNLRLGGYLARTETPGIDADDWAGSADLWWDSRHYRARLAYTDVGDGFNPELGFFTRTGVQKVRSNLTRVFWPESPKVRQWFAVHYMDYVTDQEGSIESRLNNVEVSVLFTDSSGLAFKAYDEREVLTAPFEIQPGVVLDPGRYDFQYGFFGFQTDYSKPVGGAGRLKFGEFYDGDLLQTFGAVVYRPRPGLLTVFIVDHTEVDLPAGDFTVDLVTADVNYSLGPRLSTYTKFQWNREDSVRLKVILDWRYRPGSDLFLVYDDTQDLVDTLDPHARPVALDERSILLKLTYRIGL